MDWGLVVILGLYASYVSVCAKDEVGENFNPYKILNVHKTADTSQIRKAYKNLVKEWHPDKNPSPDAQDKFIQIQQAYEILSNDDKRRQYDQQGFSKESHQQWSHQQPSFHDQFFKFSNEFFNFDYADASGQSISHADLYKKIMPNSHVAPQVLYVYSTFCTQCIITLKTSWKKAAADLEKLGLGVGTVDTTFSSRLASILRVTRVPTTVVIFKERYSYYRGIISYDNLKVFVNAQLPSNLVHVLTSNTIEGFLDRVVESDKPRTLLFSSHDQPTLLYSLMAIKHHQFIDFGFVSMLHSDAKKVASRFHIYGGGPCLLLFKEDTSEPVVTLQSSDMPRGAVDDLLTANHFMTVPRLTSQLVFDEFCPPSPNAAHQIRICAILATENDRSTFKKLRQLVANALGDDETISEWLKFMFVDLRMQQDFVNSLMQSQDSKLQTPKFFLLWRQKEGHGSLSMQDGAFLKSDVGGDYQFEKLLSVALKISQRRTFEREVNVTTLYDELAPNVFLRYMNSLKVKFMKAIDFVYLMPDQEFMLMVIMIIVMLLSVYSVLFKPTGENKQSEGPIVDEMSEDDIEVDVAYDDESEEENQQLISCPSMEELNPKSYESLVLSQQRGHMTIVFLKKSFQGDDDITTEFINVMTVHARNTRFHLSFLNVTKFMSWYLELRRSSSPNPPDSKDDIRPGKDLSSLHSNSKPAHEGDSDSTSSLNFVHGTVLAINGSKHWYCIFVPRKGRAWAVTRRRESPKRTNLVEGEPVTEVKSSDDGQVSQPTEAEVLAAPYTCNDYGNALMQWMDRVCEGQMPRLYVRQWPGLYVRKEGDEYDD